MKTYYKELLKNIEVGPVKQISFFEGPFIGQKISKGKLSTFSTCEKLLKKSNLFKNTEHQQICEDSNGKYLLEILNSSPTLVLFGGGHVCLAMAKMATLLNMPYVVVEDRNEFCNRDRFPDAKALVCCEPDKYFNELSKLNLGGNNYNVIATRGHKNDSFCLKGVLKSNYGYVGMIGSKSKVATCFNSLKDEGYSDEEINKIHSPIGINIGSETPAEISVSIFAEIIKHKNKINNFSEIDLPLIMQVVKEEKAILCQITKQSGSSPRHLGSLMLVTEDKIYGSVGGGAIELRSVNYSREMLKNNCTNPIVKQYRLNNTDASNLGMICGGNADILHISI